MITGTFDDKHVKCQSESNEQPSSDKYRENIRPYLWDMTDNLKTSGKWKKHLIIKMNFVSTRSSV